jgi:HJR/Mrr/RecB family endonuclease
MEIMNNEELVADYFKKLGYVTAIGKNQNDNGFDLIAIKDNIYLTIEIKEACKVPNKNYWRVRAVSEFAKNSEIIAIVLPSERIHFCSMKDHLKCCNQEGDRYVTEIVTCDGYGQDKG